jgi:hypothetical protein
VVVLYRVWKIAAALSDTLKVMRARKETGAPSPDLKAPLSMKHGALKGIWQTPRERNGQIGGIPLDPLCQPADPLHRSALASRSMEAPIFWAWICQ